MQALFQQMSLSVAQNGFWISDDFVPLELTETLLRHALRKFNEDGFSRAHVGKGIYKKQVQEVRKDQIYWIEDWYSPPFSPYGDLLNELRLFCRRELFLPLKRFEGHLAHYEPGAFYIRHVDRHQVQAHRLLSTVLYLNDVKEGGELVLFKGDKVLETLKPQKGRFIIFDSSLPHEVLVTHQSRWTLTSWLRDDVL
jgi:SM-20-related protein